MMSTTTPTPEKSALSPPAASQRRVLACVLCQQRKVKCNRRFPCSNCIKASVQCVQAAPAPRKRRRRPPERELINRIRYYEDLLRQHNVEFEPLKTTVSENSIAGEHDTQPRSPYEVRSPKDAATKSETIYEAKNFWNAMNQGTRDPEADEYTDESDELDDGVNLPKDILRENTVKKVWDQLFESKDHLLFGPRNRHIDLSTLHPEQVQIFRLWQIYLDNVNPLLKVTHTPTLQTRIIDAASDVTKVDPALEALMFGIYCVAVLSLADADFSAITGVFRKEPSEKDSSRKDLLASYQLGCQQALWKCEMLRSTSRDCLTAMFLYLLSVRPDTDPRSVSSMLSIAIRIAQRMGLQNESTRYDAIESEMRRRLWWALVLFDSRMSEMSNHSCSSLAPTWDCKIPQNVNDFDIRSETDMKTPSALYEKPTEAIFTVVRSELGEFVRNSNFHLDFTNPALKAIAKNVGSDTEGSEIVSFQQKIEDKYLQHCNPENPLHLMTIWTTRASLAKHRLLDHYSRFSQPGNPQSDAERDTAASHAISMLECDTTIMTSTLLKGYLWLTLITFPFPAYIHIVQDLRRRPLAPHAEQAWHAMSANYEAHVLEVEPTDSPTFKLFLRIILLAWQAREAALASLPDGGAASQAMSSPPRMIVDLKDKLPSLPPPQQQQRQRSKSGTVLPPQPQQRRQDVMEPTAMLSSGDVDMSMDLPATTTNMNTSGITNEFTAADLAMPMPMDFSAYAIPYGSGMFWDYDPARDGGGEFFSGPAAPAGGQTPNANANAAAMNQLGWGAMDWDAMYRGW